MKTAREILKAAKNLEPLERQKGMLTSFMIEMPGTRFTLFYNKAIIADEEGQELILPDKYKQEILSAIKEIVSKFHEELDRDAHKILQEFDAQPVPKAIHSDLPSEYEAALLGGYRAAVSREKAKRPQLPYYRRHGHKVHVKLSQEQHVPSVVWLYDDNKVKWELHLTGENATKTRPDFVIMDDPE